MLSFSVSIAKGFGAVPGWLPAEKPLNFPLPTLVNDHLGHDAARRIVRAEKQHVVKALGHDYGFAQHPFATSIETVAFSSDGAQHGEADPTPLPQLPDCSVAARSSLLLPYNGIDPSE